MARVTVTRFVPESERHNFTGRDVAPGEQFHVWEGPTYGCIDTEHALAVAAKGPLAGPWFEFPLDAVAFQR